MAHRHLNQAVPATAILNANPDRSPISRQEAIQKLLAFQPANDLDSVGDAIRVATGHGAHLAGRFPGTVILSGANARQWLLTVQIPVNVGVLRHRGEIMTGNLPGDSHLQQGKLLVSTTNSVFAVNMDPKTRLATFRFALAKDDHTLWSLNWNANGIVSQNNALN